MAGKNRDANADILRVLSAIAVIGLHVLRANGGQQLVLIYHCCAFAVPMFFLLSGYFLLNRYITIGYLAKKILSILKIVLFWNFVVFLPFILVSAIGANTINEALHLFISHCYNSLFQGESILFQFWYFIALIIIYTIAFCISQFAKGNNRIKYRTIFIVWIISLICSLSFQIGSYIEGFPLQSRIIQPLRIWTWAQYFLLGGLLKKTEYSWNKLEYKKIYPILFVACTIVALTIETLGGELINELHAEYFYDDFGIICWVASLFILIKSLNISGNRLIGNLVSITMGVYITHTIIRRIVIHFWDPISSVGLLVEWGLIAVLSIGVCFVIKAIPIIRKTIEM